ncbi:phenylalanine--tRNA ligase subunit beta [Candidatus Nomurabacteria bacterium]|nr:phenylalanine--tRNA ligase subunit beta [Candidatus Kaiserbacteria bacterium]MCB9814215.1 phenylalanine--tRNA ligase subunit beta [Candidatus Nomurabacteria bacterium]
MKVIHSWLKEYVGDVLPDARKVEELLNFHAFEVDGVEEVEGESVIDVDVLPNRASDCLCHRGIARELATILGVEMVEDPLQVIPDLATTDLIKVNIADQEACPRFTATLITDVEVKESPTWLQTRLKALGQRPINNIVDATNYVMYAIGQPLHAYDADLFPQVDGKWQFDVRFAKVGEMVSLLAEGGKTEDRIVELTGSELLIVDGSSDVPVGLAGVKGGRYAEVHAGTKNIIIEAAHFHPTVTRKTARGLGIVIDASKRFENEPSRELPLYAQRDIVKLIVDIAGGKFEGVHDEYLVKKKSTEVAVSIKQVNSLLGLDLSIEAVQEIIKRTGSEVRVEGETIYAIGPWERTDLNIAEDYIEEVGRIYGLNKIVSVVPAVREISEVNARQYYSEQLRQVLLEQGFSEVITTSFLNKGEIQLHNALAKDKSYVRNTLVENINNVLDANFVHADLLGISGVRVFEIGTVFTKVNSQVEEYVALTLGARTKGNGYSGQDEKIVQAACRAVSDFLGLEVDWVTEKGVAEMNLTDLLDKLPAPTTYDVFPNSDPVTYRSISPYPAVARDIALWVEEGQTDNEVLSTIVSAAGELCVRQTLFDTFTKDGRTSYAFRLVFQSPEKTLTDEEVNKVMDKINEVAKQNNWEVR